MLEILFHAFCAFLVMAGVVYFGIFSWLKMHQSDDVNDYQPEPLKPELKSTLARTF